MAEDESYHINVDYEEKEEPKKEEETKKEEKKHRRTPSVIMKAIDEKIDQVQNYLQNQIEGIGDDKNIKKSISNSSLQPIITQLKVLDKRLDTITEDVETIRRTNSISAIQPPRILYGSNPPEPQENNEVPEPREYIPRVTKPVLQRVPTTNIEELWTDKITTDLKQKLNDIKKKK